MRMQNPANEAKRQARIQGLSYWSYMEKKRPGIVQKFVWGAKKVTRKQKRKDQAEIYSAMARSNHPMMRLMAQMRNLIGGRSAY